MKDVGLKRCGQHLGSERCPCVASYRYTWPGRDEAFICGDCVPRLRAIALALGLHLQVIELECCGDVERGRRMFEAYDKARNDGLDVSDALDAISANFPELK